MSVIIGFGHKARQGKDYAVQAIIDRRGDRYDVRRYAFGDALKREVNDAAEQNGGMLGLFSRMASTLPPWVSYDPNADMTDPFSPLGKQRTLLQWWGTEYRRAADPFYLVKKLDARIKEENPQIALISDLRFLQEAFWIKSKEGYTVNVVRHGWSDLTLNSQHESEKALDGYAYDITLTVLDGEIEALRRESVELFDMICDWLDPKLTQEDFLIKAA